MRAGYSQFGNEFLVEDATICWDPAYPDAVTSETLTVWSPDIGSYTYTVDCLGHVLGHGTVTARFADANGVAAAPHSGDYNIANAAPGVHARRRDQQPIRRAAGQSGSAREHGKLAARGPRVVADWQRTASTLMLPWVDMLDFDGFEPEGYAGGRAAAAAGRCDTASRRCRAAAKTKTRTANDGKTNY